MSVCLNMRLNRIHIGEYKNLKDVEIDFSACDNVAVFAGRNGSGKSNFLEAVSLIMKEHLGYGDVDERLLFYEAEFDSCGTHVKVKRQIGCQETSLLNSSRRCSGRQQVIAMYCGEFKRLLEFGYKRDEGRFSAPDLTAISVDNYPIALLTMVLSDAKSMSAVLDVEEGLISINKLEFRLETPVVDIREEGPQNEFEEIFWRLSNVVRQSDGTREISPHDFLEIISCGNELSPRMLYWVLSQLVDKETFSHLDDISITFGLKDGSEFSSNDLSEGEKRFVLLKATCEYLSDDDALLLLDEPDAYINDSRKLDLYDMIVANAARGVTILMTTHSPLLIDYIPDNRLFVFEKEGGLVKVHKGSKYNALVALTDSRMSIFSTRPILMLEGKSDLNIIEHAISALGRLDPRKYGTFRLSKAFDVYIMGGAQCAVEQLRLLKKYFPNRRIELIFDNDNGGRSGRKGCEEECTENIRTHLLPAPDGCAGDFGIEEYFEKRYLVECINEQLSAPNCKGFQSIPNFKDQLKKELGSKSDRIPPDAEFKRFSKLVDLIMRLSE